MNDNTVLHYYILSDSIGETAQKVAKASFAQFPNVTTVSHKYTFISNHETLQSILEDANEHDGLVFMTIADAELAKFAEKYCIKTGLICYNLIQPFTLEIARRLETEPSAISGAQYELSEDYFDRIRAMEFCLAYDDGKDPKGFLEADVVLLGVSRTSKTPLSLFLANKNLKVANLPLVPETHIPKEIYEIDPKKIIGLTNDPSVLNEIRRQRMIAYGLNPDTTYSNMDSINKELESAQALYKKLGCYVINVAHRSIEETAALILEHLGIDDYAK